MRRTLEGQVLVHHLTEAERSIDRTLLARHGRSARTLVKEGPLRLTIIAVAAGGELAPHSAAGPIMVHVLEGEVSIDAAGHAYVLSPGDILVLAPGVEHSVRSEAGGVLLLTVVTPTGPDPGSRTAA